MTTPTHARIADPLSALLLEVEENGRGGRARPDLTGRRAIVTGGARGLGLATSTTLAARGASVLVGVRDAARGQDALDRAAEEHGIPRRRLKAVQLDLIDLDSVARFATEAAIERGAAGLDLLVLNAGISSVDLALSARGIESQFATNHLGHFALAALLLPALGRAANPRVVTVASALYSAGRLAPEELTAPERLAVDYGPGRAYNRSKLANVLFARELERRARQAGSRIVSVAAHPGMARTPLHSTYPSAATRAITTALVRAVGRDPLPAAVGILAAATMPEATPDLFWGPAGSKTRPDAVGAAFAPVASDAELAVTLWDASEHLTGVAFPSPVGGA